MLTIMLCKNIAILFLSITIASGVRFRFDYEFNHEADGWLKLHLVPQIWSVARLMCHAEGAVLASPLTFGHEDAMLKHVSERSSVREIFTGVHATLAKGVYTSVEGVPLAKLHITWAPGEPDNFRNSESCLSMSIINNGTMKDVECSVILPFVCYKKREPVLVNGCGTIDSDYSLETKTGSCYKFHRRGQTWSQAFMTCVAEGGHLAIINSEKEAAILGELHTKNKDNVIFSKNPHIAAIGFRDWEDGGSWMTVHGETLPEAGFNRWWDHGPDNVTRAPHFSSELCGSIVRSGVINDVACDVILPFICEKQPESLENNEELFR